MAEYAVLRGPRVHHPAPEGIPGLVRDQRRRTPDAVAASDPRRRMTYAQLDRRSDELAGAIGRVTGGRRGAVALRMPRQVDVLVALLGVLKAGCYYMPVATDEPETRIASMMDTVDPLCTVVAAGDEQLALPGRPALVVPRSGRDDGPYTPLPAVEPDDPVYALFTSGSTGTPKAVLVGSAALTNRISWMARRFALTGQDRVLQKTPYTFDVAGWEFFLPLVTGARCVFAPVDAHYDARAIGDVISRAGITVCHFVPTMLEEYLRLAPVETNTSLRLVFCSGEALTAGLAARLYGRLDTALHNLYGPTEAGIDVTHWPVPRDIAPGAEVLIGAPIDNVELRVLDERGAPVAPGASGELSVGGVQVALGYAGRPDLTDQAFTVHDGQRWYRTGDHVSIVDGQVRYLGRIDDQVKIRGVRVEPAEIEAVLAAHPAVGQAAVVAVPDGDGLDLVAIAVPAATAQPGPADHEVLAYVGQHLPRAFVPRRLYWVDHLPLTPSGKSDRRRLTEDAQRWSAAVATGPSQVDDLADVWWRLLGTPAAHRRDDVGFLNLGGHSLVAARLVADIAAHHHVEVPLSVLLRDNVSLAGLRTVVAAAPPVAARPVTAPTSRTDSPLTPAQEPLWLLSRVLADDSGNNVVGSLLVPGDLEPDRLRAALADVVARHDVLRAGIVMVDGVPRWTYAARAEVTVRTATVPVLDDATIADFVAGIAGTVIAPSAAPLLTAGVLRGPGSAVLTLSLHHLVADQRGLDIVLADLAFAYSARSAGRAPRWSVEAASFADFAHARAATVGTAAWSADLAYWQRLLRDAPARTPLPFRLSGPALPTLDGRRHVARLGRRLTAGIDAFLTRAGHTRATYLVACVAAVLAAWSGEESVAVGMPVSQRRGPGDADLAGLVLGTVPLWLTVGDRIDRDRLLAHVRDRYLEALEHATPTFQAIVRRLGLPPSPQDNPLFQVWVNDLSRLDPPPLLDGVATRRVELAPPGALFDLNFYLRRDDDGYRLELVGRVDVYEDAVVAEVLEQVVAVATAFAHDRPAFADLQPQAQLHPESQHAPEPETSESIVDSTQETVLDAIRRVAAGHLDAPAIVHDGQSVTYAGLMATADQVAQAVTAAGVGAGDLLELRATRTPDLPATLLGAWRADVVVAITDAQAPAAVLAEQTGQLRPYAVLTTGSGSPGHSLPDRHRSGGRRLDQVSHVLFTSGTSGRPAAVAVPPRALAATLRWYVTAYRLGPTDRVAMLGGLGHDPLLRDILAPLLSGATVVVPPADILARPAQLFTLLRDERITVLNATPALLELILSGRTGSGRLDHLRLVVSGGAPLTAGLVRAVRAVTTADVVNAYGTTETPQIASAHTVGAIDDRVSDEAVLPIGAGVGGARLHVVRPDGTPAPVGHAGEVVVTSPYLAAGYLDGGDRRFDPAGRTYSTGDRGRLDPYGGIVLDGRLDRQLSVDGHRLDPEQIERAVLRHPGVQRALARLTPTAAGPVLSLSVIAPPGPAAPTVADLRSHLRRTLPRYAVPTDIQVVAEFVLDRHHKVAGVRAAVPASGARTGSGVPALLDQMARLVREVFSVELSPTENFFDAGLSSMAIVRLHALLRERLGADLPVTVMFERPNLAALARFLADPPPPAAIAGEPRIEERDTDRARQRRHLRQQIRREFEGRHEQPRSA